jgi:hypothetical protein
MHKPAWRDYLLKQNRANLQRFLLPRNILSFGSQRLEITNSNGKREKKIACVLLKRF